MERYVQYTHFVRIRIHVHKAYICINVTLLELNSLIIISFKINCIVKKKEAMNHNCDAKKKTKLLVIVFN